MCGIVGLFLKDKSLEPALGRMLTSMLITMTDRGSDSAGIAIYSNAAEAGVKLTVQSGTPEIDFGGLAEDLKNVLGAEVSVTERDTHAVIEVSSDQVTAARAALAQIRPNVRVLSVGEAIEIYKEVGRPDAVAQRFEVGRMSGSHGIGHTRMATESAVTTMGAHPFSTGPDQCLVHNGSLSNHNSLRRRLRRDGVHIETENDSEVAAA
jgi:glutamate synthase domain-containing protein 1